MKFVAEFKNQLIKLAEDDLIAIRIALDKEFSQRKIKFSVGEVGEILAIKYFNLTPGLENLQRAPVGTKNVDALSRKGDRYSIKTIKDGNKSGTIYPDKKEKEKQLFEYMLLVILNENYELSALYRFSWKQFFKIKQWDSTMNAWYISKANNRLKEGDLIYEKK